MTGSSAHALPDPDWSAWAAWSREIARQAQRAAESRAASDEPVIPVTAVQKQRRKPRRKK